MPQKAAALQAFVSTEKADVSNAPLQFVSAHAPVSPAVRATAPLPGKGYNGYGERLLLQVDDATVCLIPPQWTDV